MTMYLFFVVDPFIHEWTERIHVVWWKTKSLMFNLQTGLDISVSLVVWYACLIHRFIFHHHAQWIQLNLERENDVTTLYEQWLSIIMLAIFNCRSLPRLDSPDCTLVLSSSLLNFIYSFIWYIIWFMSG